MLLVNDNPIIEGLHLKDCMEKVHRDLMATGSYYHQLLLDSGSEGNLWEVIGCRGQLQFGIKVFWGIFRMLHFVGQR
jgi:hypothetical protein